MSNENLKLSLSAGETWDSERRGNIWWSLFPSLLMVLSIIFLPFVWGLVMMMIIMMIMMRHQFHKNAQYWDLILTRNKTNIEFNKLWPSSYELSFEGLDRLNPNSIQYIYELVLVQIQLNILLFFPHLVMLFNLHEYGDHWSIQHTIACVLDNLFYFNMKEN